MAESIALPSALAELETRLASAADDVDLRQILRALQRLRLTETDLRVHIERIRARNDVTVKDEQTEENCLHALDLVGGYSVGGLKWDARALAPVFLAAVLDQDSLAAGFEYAVIPNDLLPPRPFDRLDQEVSRLLVQRTADYLQQHDYKVEPADIFRCPKSAFTTRPAALLALPDRLALEALAEQINERLERALPENVLWPRGRTPSPSVIGPNFRQRPLEWDSRYVVKADIADFYGSIGHTLLGLITSTHLAMPKRYGQALESFLSALMEIDQGLPQGAPASDLLASAFLLPLDSDLADSGMDFIRYADDYLFPAESLDEARTVIGGLEERLRGLGLVLNDDKTAIMRSATYRQGLNGYTDAVNSLRRTLGESRVRSLEESDDPDWVSDKLQEYGVDEEELWGLFYHGNRTLGQVIEELGESVDPSMGEAYELILKSLVDQFDSDRPLDKGAEGLGRECLTFLAATKTVVPLAHIETLLEWFPKFAPDVSVYLRSIVGIAGDNIASVLIRYLDRQPKLDWATAWLCSAVDRPGCSLGDELTARLKRAAIDRSEGLLTRASAIRALAVAGILEQPVWSDLLDDSTAAIRSEMEFSRLFEPDLYRDLQDSEPAHLAALEMPGEVVRTLRSITGTADE